MCQKEVDEASRLLPRVIHIKAYTVPEKDDAGVVDPKFNNTSLSQASLFSTRKATHGYNQVTSPNILQQSGMDVVSTTQDSQEKMLELDETMSEQRVCRL